MRLSLLEVPRRFVSAGLLLRAFEPGDGLALFDAIDRSRDALRPWLPWVDAHRTRDDSEAWAREASARFTLREDLSFAVLDEAGALLGGAGLHRFDLDVGRFELGYWMRADRRRRGLGALAARELMSLAFLSLGAVRVEARIDARNAPSARLAASLGMRHEGTLRRDSVGADGTPRDTMVFSMLADEHARAPWASSTFASKLAPGRLGALPIAPVHPRVLSDERAPLGLVLSGGGARGAFQVGVWKVLHDEAGLREPAVVSGTSAGALNGALIAAGLSPRDMLEFWLGLADAPPVRANPAFFASLERALGRLLLNEPLKPLWRRGREARILTRVLRQHRWFAGGAAPSMLLEYLLTARFDLVSEALDRITTSYLFDTSPVRDRLRQAIGRDGIRGARVRLAINTVDVRTGGVVRIVNATPTKRSAEAAAHYRVVDEITLDMILASASIPLLFNPVRVGAELLWDGGLLVNTPIAPAVALGARRILPVLVTSGGAGTGEGLPTFGAAVERLADAFLENAYHTDKKLLLSRNVVARAEGEGELAVVELFEPVRPQTSRTFNAGSYLYFERHAMTAMHDAGVEAARTWLRAGPRLDS